MVQAPAWFSRPGYQSCFDFKCQHFIHHGFSAFILIFCNSVPSMFGFRASLWSRARVSWPSCRIRSACHLRACRYPSDADACMPAHGVIVLLGRQARAGPVTRPALGRGGTAELQREPAGPEAPVLRRSPEELQRWSNKDAHTCVPSSTIHRSQKVETVKVLPHTGRSLSQEQEGAHTRCPGG